MRPSKMVDAPRPARGSARRPGAGRFDRRPGEDEAADTLRRARGELHRDVPAERQADDDGPPAACAVDRRGDAVRRRPSSVNGSSGQRAVPGQVQRDRAERRPTGAVDLRRPGRRVSRVPWRKTIARGDRTGPVDVIGGRRIGRADARRHRPGARDPCWTANRAACVRLARPELGEDVGDVGPGRPLGDPELVGDRLVRQPARDAGEDLALPAPSGSPGWPGRCPGRGRPVRRHRRPVAPRPPSRIRRPVLSGRAARARRSRPPPGSRWTSPAIGGADRGGEVVGLGVLEEEPARAGLDRGRDPVLVDEARERDDLDRGMRALISAVAAIPSMLGISRSITTTSGRNSAAPPAPSAPSGRLADDLEVVVQREEVAHAAADHRMVVDEQDPDPVAPSVHGPPGHASARPSSSDAASAPAGPVRPRPALEDDRGREDRQGADGLDAAPATRRAATPPARRRPPARTASGCRRASRRSPGSR